MPLFLLFLSNHHLHLRDILATPRIIKKSCLCSSVHY
jgi:hypothetical protein